MQSIGKQHALWYIITVKKRHIRKHHLSWINYPLSRIDIAVFLSLDRLSCVKCVCVCVWIKGSNNNILPTFPTSRTYYYSSTIHLMYKACVVDSWICLSLTIPIITWSFCHYHIISYLYLLYLFIFSIPPHGPHLKEFKWPQNMQPPPPEWQCIFLEMQQFCPTSSPFRPIIAKSSQGLLWSYPNLFKRGPIIASCFQTCIIDSKSTPPSRGFIIMFSSLE